MGREILTLHFGQAGVQIGSALWELFCIEHGLTVDGLPVRDDDSNELALFENVGCLFYEGQKSWTPRAVMIDLEPTVIDEIRCGAYRQLWRPNCLITGKEDAANNYGRGNCTVGKLKMEETSDAIRKLVENSNNLAAFEIIHSQSGGTGSGMTSLMIDQLCDEYGKKFKFSSSIFPSSMYSQSTVDPYNSILQSHATIETLDCDILVDNQTLFDRCTKNLGINQPTYTDINRLLAQMLSSVFLSHRFVYHGSQHADTTELLTNLIPYPRIHFPSLFYAPLLARNQMEHDSLSVQELTKAVFTEDAQTLDFPCRRNAYISCAMLYRGVTSPKQVYDALQIIKGTPNLGASFVDWCPTGFKIGLNIYPPISFQSAPVGESPRSVCMLAGNLGMREAWHRNNLKFDVLFGRRCFVHWFVGEGIEESEFIEARDDLAYLEQDYTELLSEAIDSNIKNDTQNNENNSRLLTKLPDPTLTHPRFIMKQDLDVQKSTNNINNNIKYKNLNLNNNNDNTNIKYNECINSTSNDKWLITKNDYSNNYEQYYELNQNILNNNSNSATNSWNKCNDYVNETKSSNCKLSMDSDLNLSEQIKNRITRETNRNNPRFSQASDESTFLPTDPLVKHYDTNSSVHECSTIGSEYDKKTKHSNNDDEQYSQCSQRSLRNHHKLHNHNCRNHSAKSISNHLNSVSSWSTDSLPSKQLTNISQAKKITLNSSNHNNNEQIIENQPKNLPVINQNIQNENDINVNRCLSMLSNNSSSGFGSVDTSYCSSCTSSLSLSNHNHNNQIKSDSNYCYTHELNTCLSSGDTIQSNPSYSRHKFNHRHHHHHYNNHHHHHENRPHNHNHQHHRNRQHNHQHRLHQNHQMQNEQQESYDRSPTNQSDNNNNYYKNQKDSIIVPSGDRKPSKHNRNNDLWSVSDDSHLFTNKSLQKDGCSSNNIMYKPPVYEISISSSPDQSPNPTPGLISWSSYGNPRESTPIPN